MTLTKQPSQLLCLNEHGFVLGDLLEETVLHNGFSLFHSQMAEI